MLKFKADQKYSPIYFHLSYQKCLNCFNIYLIQQFQNIVALSCCLDEIYYLPLR